MGAVRKEGKLASIWKYKKTNELYHPLVITPNVF
jgi:hypothetical protein